MKSAPPCSRLESCSSTVRPPRCYASTNRRSRRATYPAVCCKRATLLGNADRANRELRCGRNRPSGWTLSVQVFGPGGTRSEYRSRIFWIDGLRTWAAAKAPQRKRPCRSRATARRSLFVRALSVAKASRSLCVRSQIENYRAKAKKFARLAAVAKSLRHSRQCGKLAEMYWALALGEEPDRAQPSKTNVKRSTT